VTDPNPILIGYLAQMIKGIYMWSLALAMAFFLSSCGDNDSTDTVVSLRIDPPTSTIAVGATTSLTVNAVLAKAPRPSSRVLVHSLQRRK
jgi:ABC-type uncharacterized transport system auxiliary subunit